MLSDIINTNWYEILIVIYRAFISLIILFLITKIIGKKHASELSLFDYVISISIGNFAAEISMNVDVQFLNGVVAVIIFGVVAALVSFFTMKSMKIRKIIMGSPTMIIQDGKFVYKNLKNLKLDINDFLETARIAGYFDVGQIKYALMEANGKVSFLPKKEYKNVTVKDLDLKIKDEGLCANIIIDGKVIISNLKKINKTEEWLDEVLLKNNTKKENILLLTIDLFDNVTIYNKNSDIKVVNVLE